MKYYVHLQQEEGPFSYEELKSKQLSKDTPAWHEGLPEWITVGEIEELKGLFTPVPPPFQKSTTPQPPSFNGTANEPKLATASAKTEIYEAAEEYPWQQKKKRFSTGAIVGISAGLMLLILFVILLKNKGSENTTASTAEIYPKDSIVTSTNNELETLKAAEEQRRKKNEELTRKNMEIRNNWQRYFKASGSTYYVGGFGGISDLTVYFENFSDYTVDEMIVRVYYYLANGNLHGTNDAVVTNLSPGERKSFRVPDTGRGIKAEIKIIKVYGSKFHFLYSEVYNSGNPEDPFYSN